MKRTEAGPTPDAASCVAVLAQVVATVERSHVIRPMLRATPQLRQLLEAAHSALEGKPLAKMLCADSTCGWIGLFPHATPSAFKCPICGCINCEVLP